MITNKIYHLLEVIMGNAINVAVIGGSGVYKLDAIKIEKSLKVLTPFGDPSGEILQAKVGDSNFYFLPRHGIGHTLTPSEVNYRANIYALKKLGVKYIVSVSAVGSLKEELPPTKFVLVDQFIDWTKGQRERTFFGNGVVGHVSCAHPIEKNLQKRMKEACEKASVDFAMGGSYICIEGPQFSTRAESLFYKNTLGASVIGMTNVTEAFLAKEAGMAYATVAMVTDYDCWREGEHCTLEEIMKVMETNYKSVQKLIVELIPSLCKNPVDYTPENKMAVVTDPNKIKEKHKEILDIILS